MAKQDDWESRRPLSILRTRRDRQWALPGHIKPVLLKSHQIQHQAKTLEGLFDISRDPLGSDESIYQVVESLAAWGKKFVLTHGVERVTAKTRVSGPQLA